MKGDTKMPKFHRKNKKLPTSEEIEAQKANIKKIRTLLGEKGCNIFNLADRFMYSADDFLAIPTTPGTTGVAMMVRIISGGIIEVRLNTDSGRALFEKFVAVSATDFVYRFGLPLPDNENRGAFAVFIHKTERRHFQY
jgi:hypothetical protein